MTSGTGFWDETAALPPVPPLDLRNRRAFGVWTSIGHPLNTEILVEARPDFVGIDLEHSTISLEQAQQIIAAAHAGGVACLPRIASHNGEQIKRLLDAGADGVIVPMVSTPAEVEAIIAWTKYPPLGRRPYGVARGQRFGFGFERYTRDWNTRSTLIIQIESVAGVDAVADLLAYDSIDGAMIGPYDLSGSLGIPGMLADPRVVEASRKVVDTCTRLGKACGTHVIDPDAESVAAAFAAGYSFVILGSDLFVLSRWSHRMLTLIREHGRAGGR